ncbi:winged helix-turn-helix domain-containing protein [Vibrio sp. SCSIO 43137]|uniref:winged helix-turn-helix domain-containing protein n=1 Tax=Vibrio sp. SCSIO 43137 TaxID=3021011 RepID=UPI002307B45B|nr:winged helix-turn-helix domain-containing protein [Vibrio sp. SCSIO 43137]WCE31428.1 winged helix-turn-helix domain-containing protein [Vibrio sp. SCSIO 43137]
MSEESTYLLDDRYFFDPNKRSINDKTGEEQTIWLGSNESNILLAFSKRPGELISRELLHDLVWTEKGFHVDDSSVIQAISTLRKMLNDSVKSPSFIKTIPKHGYQFIASVVEVNDKQTSEKPASADVSKVDSESDAATSNGLSSEQVSKKGSATFILAAIFTALLTFSLIFESERSPFVVLDKVEGGPVKTIKEHVLFAQDRSTVLNCVKSFMGSIDNKESLREVIINMDSRGSVLFHISDEDNAYSSTIDIIAEKGELAEECQRVWGSYEK